MSKNCVKGAIQTYLRYGALALVAALVGAAEEDSVAHADNTTRVDLYGFAMLDMGYQGRQNDPLWFDVVRPTKLPSIENEFGENGRWFSGVRQTRFGVKSFTPTPVGELRTTFEWELFGTGVDAGQTTLRLRHAYGELGQFGAGQYWSPFMDIDVFPNSIEYWGPNGMVFFRNVQVRWMPIQGESRMTIALERPGASADGGTYADRIIGQNVMPRFPVPDVSAEYRHAGSWGYAELAGIVRHLRWDDLNPAAPDLSGNVTGWGLNLSSNLKVRNSDTVRLAVMYGEGVQNYMNDAPADVAVDSLPSGELEGTAIPVLGVVAFYDLNWNESWSTSIGYSLVDIDNTSGQAGAAFRRGHYALANLLHYPAENVMLGGELQWAERENKNGFTSHDVRFQFSARYRFSTSIGG